MTTLKDKSEFSKSCPLVYENNELYEVALNYIGDIIKTKDVKEAVLEFENVLKRAINDNCHTISTKDTLDVFKDIFGDFQDETTLESPSKKS